MQLLKRKYIWFYLIVLWIFVPTVSAQTIQSNSSITFQNIIQEEIQPEPPKGDQADIQEIPSYKKPGRFPQLMAITETHIVFLVSILLILFVLLKKRKEGKRSEKEVFSNRIT
ncbi:hypothetical protein [Enterococcus casseliflavus]|uniref:hypothetical protein n=1 Tax=Enterococcus casseliflavus TaxID=37734 RepID=UPI000FF8B63A|nr:hypothetical protein [Enterococcus casseliflavus]RXA59024.1 hypothetical protein EQ871_16510 [Enterococcus casseliflavus]RXA67472.1 hypothetical protein EQ870_17025 [Enterococcus casseliflavus]